MKKPLYERDRMVLDRQEDPVRKDVIACTIAAYRREDRLSVGDEAPALDLRTLEGSDTVRLRDPGGERPLVLIFGSYT